MSAIPPLSYICGQGWSLPLERVPSSYLEDSTFSVTFTLA